LEQREALYAALNDMITIKPSELSRQNFRTEKIRRQLAQCRTATINWFLRKVTSRQVMHAIKEGQLRARKNFNAPSKL
jgi:hypothetical protein